MVSVTRRTSACVLRRDGDFQVRLDRAVAAAELGLVGGEDDLVVVGGAGRPADSRPTRACRCAGRGRSRTGPSASRVRSSRQRVTSRPRQVLRPAAGVGEHDVVLAVGEQVGARVGRVRRGQPPAHRGGWLLRRRSARRAASSPCASTIGASRGMRSCKQQLGGPDHRLGVEAPRHRRRRAGVGQGRPGSSPGGGP